MCVLKRVKCRCFVSEWLYLLALTRSSSAPPCQSVSQSGSGWGLRFGSKDEIISSTRARFRLLHWAPSVNNMAMCFLRQLAAEMTMIVAVLLAEAKKQKLSGKKTETFRWLQSAVCTHNRPRFQRPSDELQTHLGCACRLQRELCAGFAQ